MTRVAVQFKTAPRGPRVCSRAQLSITAALSVRTNGEELFTGPHVYAEFHVYVYPSYNDCYAFLLCCVETTSVEVN